MLPSIGKTKEDDFDLAMDFKKMFTSFCNASI